MSLNLLQPAPPSVTLSIYDRLPAEVRAAISRADFAYDPRIVARRIARGVKPQRIISEIDAFQRRRRPW
jgi:hypothetical protein